MEQCLGTITLRASILPMIVLNSLAISKAMREQRNELRQAVARRAVAPFTERDGYKSGQDQNHSLQAEQELIYPDRPIVERDGSTQVVRVRIHAPVGSRVLASISPWSIISICLPDEMGNKDSLDIPRELFSFVSLPAEVDPAQVAASIDSEELTIRLSVCRSLNPRSQPSDDEISGNSKCQ